jgi:hypothetical protein
MWIRGCSFGKRTGDRPVHTSGKRCCTAYIQKFFTGFVTQKSRRITTQGIAIRGFTGEQFSIAISDALGLPREWLNPDTYGDLDAKAGDLLLIFRRRVEPPVMPPTWKLRQGFEPNVAAYQGRQYAVGTFEFGVAANTEKVSEIASTFFRRFCPQNGLSIRVSSQGRQEVLKTRFSQTASVRADQLKRGCTIELTEWGDFEFTGQGGRPLFWLASPTASEHTPKRLRFGFCIDRPGAERPERLLAEAMDVVFRNAVQLEGCLSAIITAQGVPMTLANSAFPYEILVRGGAKAGDPIPFVDQVRSPGWRMLIPSPFVRRLSASLPNLVVVERCHNGLLARFDVPTPFELGATTELERWLLPLLRPKPICGRPKPICGRQKEQ